MDSLFCIFAIINLTLFSYRPLRTKIAVVVYVTYVKAVYDFWTLVDHGPTTVLFAKRIFDYVLFSIILPLYPRSMVRPLLKDLMQK